MIQLTATYVFEAPVEKAWDLLMDTDVIAACLPGCRRLQPIGGDRYEVELGVALAAVSGSFKGTIALENMTPPNSYKLVADGTGRQGFIKGQAQVTLLPQTDRTLVHIAATAQAGGLIARVGQRLLESGARTMMDRFYACLASRAQASQEVRSAQASQEVRRTGDLTEE